MNNIDTNCGKLKKTFHFETLNCHQECHLKYRRVMGFRGSSVFVGSFSGAFSRARGKISQLTHVYKYLPRVACCLIKMLSMKFTSIFASSFSRGRVGKQVLYLMTISCRFSSRCRSGTSAQKI